MANILVIEDEQSLQMLLKYDLESYNHVVSFYGDGLEGLKALEQNNYDLAIIDWMLPSLSGYDIIKEIRKANQDLKIIMLSAKDDEIDIVRGLDVGADDYLTKPFSSRELNARINVLLRNQVNSQLKFKDLIVDKDSRSLTKSNEEIFLSKIEFDLLVYFIENKGIVLSRELIYEKLWDFSAKGDLRSVDVHVSSIKKKLNLKHNVISKRGVGYQLVD